MRLRRRRFLRRLPLRVVLLAVARPRATLGVAGLLCGACLLLAHDRLPSSADQNKLFSPDVPFFRDYLDFVRQFPENDSAYVLVEPADAAGPPPSTARWAALADAIAGRLRGMPDVVTAVHARVPSAALGDRGLLFESPAVVPARRAEVERFLPMVRLWAERPTLLTRPLGASGAERFVNALRLRQVAATAGLDVGSDAETAPFVAAVLRSWDRALADPALPLTPGAGLPDLDALGVSSPRDLGYFYVPDESDKSRNVLLIGVYPKEDYSSSTALSEAVDAIRAATADVARGFPEFRVGVTGRPALEADEMRTTDADGRLSGVVAMSAVFAGLVLFLRSVRLAVAAVASLCVGIGLTYGWAAVAVGEMNLLSDVFLIALIGIGMDYFVQSLSRYRVEAARNGGGGAGGGRGAVARGGATARRDPRRVWVAVVRQVATPVTTACLGAAGAFGVAVLTPFKGAADLGVIAGGGLLLCLACGFTVLPALLTVWHGSGRHARRTGSSAATEMVNADSRIDGRSPVPSPLYAGDRVRVRGRSGRARSCLQWLRGAVPPIAAAHPNAGDAGASREGESNSTLGPSPQPSPPSTGERGPEAVARRRRRRLLVTPVLWLLALAAALPFALRSRFDPGLLNLQAPDAESVRLVRKLQTWSAVVLSKDLAVLRRAREALGGSPEIASTESLLDAQDNAGWLRANAGSVRAIRWADPTAPRPGDVAGLAAAVRAVGDQFAAVAASVNLPTADRAALADAAAAAKASAGRLDAAVAKGRSTTEAAAAASRLAAWQSAFAGQLRGTLAQFDPPAGPGPNDPAAVATLPPELRKHFVSDDGTYALYVYPAHDLWQREHLERFVGDVERRLSAVPGVPAPTGIAVNILHSTTRVQASFLRATAYALGLIVVLVFLDLRRPGQTMLAVSVLALGLPMLAGVMTLLGVAWNLANFFGLPILIGAGHEYGVFTVHRYREAVRDPRRRAWAGWDASDWALLLCAYVTSASFGFFWLIARHQGLKSLGLVMALGTACIYLATVAVLRPVLKWRLGVRSRDEG
jgi:predicted RND superfamily exporter protein